MTGKLLKMLIRSILVLWLSLSATVLAADEINNTVSTTPKVVSSTTSSHISSSSVPGSTTTASPPASPPESGTIAPKSAPTTTTASAPTAQIPTSTAAPTNKSDTTTPDPSTSSSQGSPAPTSTPSTEQPTTSSVAGTTPALNSNGSTNGTNTSSTAAPTEKPGQNSSVSPTQTAVPPHTTSTPSSVTPKESSNTPLSPVSTTTTAMSTAATKEPTSSVAPKVSTSSSIPSTSTLPPQKPVTEDQTSVTTPENVTKTTVTAQTNPPLVNTTTTPVATRTSPVTTPQVKTSTTVTPVASSSVAPEPGMKEVIYINEVLVDKNGQIQKIELHLSDNLNVTKYAMVMVDGSNNKYTSLTYLKNVIKGDNNLMLVSFGDNVPMMKEKGMGIAIYNTDQIPGGLTTDWTLNTVGLVDALVIGKTYEETSENLIQVLTPGAYPFIVNPSLYGQQKSISRCSSDLVCDSSMFALINPSLGLYNKERCQQRLINQKAFALKLHADCDLFYYPNKTIDSEKLKLVMRHILREVNRKCRCGITEMHVTGPPSMQCCGDLTLNMKFAAQDPQQEADFLSSYRSYLKATSSITVDQNTYTVDTGCYRYCCNEPAPAAKKDSSNQVKVTVAVVVSCLIVFLIIVIILVMYMRRKKSAVYQFRMSRLTEEDDDLNVDGPDCDDFVGGQEATFDLKR